MRQPNNWFATPKFDFYVGVWYNDNRAEQLGPLLDRLRAIGIICVIQLLLLQIWVTSQFTNRPIDLAY